VLYRFGEVELIHVRDDRTLKIEIAFYYES